MATTVAERTQPSAPDARLVGLRAQRLCAAGAFVLPPVALAAMFGCGVMPPPAAHDSAAKIASLYLEHGDRRTVGALVGFIVICLLAPLVCVITLQLMRIEGRRPLLSFLQLIAGTFTWVLLSVPLLLMIVTAFRPDRSPEITQTLNDMAYILFLIPIGPFIVQNLAIAAATLGDRGAEPVFPRWVAWANLWIALSFVPDLLLPFFFHGPFAYHGLFAFWIPTVTYGLWLNLMAYASLRAIAQEERAELATP